MCVKRLDIRNKLDTVFQRIYNQSRFMPKKCIFDSQLETLSITFAY